MGWANTLTMGNHGLDTERQKELNKFSGESMSHAISERTSDAFEKHEKRVRDKLRALQIEQKADRGKGFSKK